MTIYFQETFPREMCKSVVELARSNPVLPVPERVTEEQRDRSRAACSASVVHQVFVRKIVRILNCNTSLTQAFWSFLEKKLFLLKISCTVGI